MKKCLLDKEYDEVKEIVKNSGLWPAVKSAVIEYDKVTISVFYEWFYGMTDTMLFPSGEMALTPDGAHQIIFLEVEGKSIKDGYDEDISWENLFKLTKILFGLDEKQSESMFVMKDIYGSKKLSMKELRGIYYGTQEIHARKGSVDLVRINATAPSCFLYVLDNCIFPDSYGSLVDGKYLQILHPFDQMHNYSWGNAVVGFLNAELTKASRALTKQVNGNLCLFQVILLSKSFIFEKCL
ncbi:uncharacterized protein LOC113306226 [Papaver somniferum]|uniref:uncharacterized protein LOC113306226 n=1 Tax=Papaver somniferum TaxID=3469 RepID=UPI000E6F7F21|nr:uncharacterized protein LOC113306226 [Papaver somniferum]